MGKKKKKNALLEHQSDLAKFVDELTNFCHGSMLKHHVSIVELCGCLDAIKYMYLNEGERFATAAADSMKDVESASGDIEDVVSTIDDLLKMLSREGQ